MHSSGSICVPGGFTVFIQDPAQWDDCVPISGYRDIETEYLVKHIDPPYEAAVAGPYYYLEVILLLTVVVVLLLLLVILLPLLLLVVAAVAGPYLLLDPTCHLFWAGTQGNYLIVVIDTGSIRRAATTDLSTIDLAKTCPNKQIRCSLISISQTWGRA